MVAWANADAVRQTRRERPGHVLEPVARRAVAEGRHQRQRASAVECACGSTATATRCWSRSSPAGPACHTGSRSCFGADGGGVLGRLRGDARGPRRDADPATSYTARILHGPRSYVARKVGEEAAEVLTEEPGSDALVGEVADLWFHSLLLLARDGVDPLEPLERAALAPRR